MIYPVHNPVFSNFHRLQYPQVLFRDLRSHQLVQENSIDLSLEPKSSIPNSEFVGFQSLGPGTGDTKMHGPKKPEQSWNLEPFTVGLLG